eukprot:COSAG01_NODE_25768_length_733_cov_41.334385_2_plen_164_part_00
MYLSCWLPSSRRTRWSRSRRPYRSACTSSLGAPGRPLLCDNLLSTNLSHSNMVRWIAKDSVPVDCGTLDRSYYYHYLVVARHTGQRPGTLYMVHSLAAHVSSAHSEKACAFRPHAHRATADKYQYRDREKHGTPLPPTLPAMATAATATATTIPAGGRCCLTS